MGFEDGKGEKGRRAEAEEGNVGKDENEWIILNHFEINKF